MSSLLLRDRSAGFAAFVLMGVLGASWLPTYLAGGASKMPPLWFFVPILLAGVRFGTPGAALAALAASLLAGPLTPGDVAHHTAQQQSDWLIRGGFFLGIGLVMASVTQRLQSEADENRRGREETQAMRDEDARTGALQREFSETLQVAHTEDEAHQIVKRHVQRSIPAAKVVVLSRNNIDNRLAPATAMDGGPDIEQLILDATPESCLAVRFGREHQRGPDEQPLLECDVCGHLPGRSTCVPSLVGGHVIGSVLVEHASALGPREKQRISESVSQAAPVLANLRNLVLAETRAATDALTGLPNRRAAESSLKQMAARAGRSVSPLSAVLVDLDHFKLVNDRHGHNRGDELLARGRVGFQQRTSGRGLRRALRRRRIPGPAARHRYERGRGAGRETPGEYRSDRAARNRGSDGELWHRHPPRPRRGRGNACAPGGPRHVPGQGGGTQPNRELPHNTLSCHRGDRPQECLDAIKVRRAVPIVPECGRCPHILIRHDLDL